MGIRTKNILESTLPHDVCDLINSQIPPSNASPPDQLCWMATNSSKFTISSVIESFTDEENLSDMQELDKQTLWKAIWSWQGSLRAKFCMWLATLGRLLTKSQRKRKHLTDDGDYCRCHNREEVVLLVLWDYEEVAYWWHRLIPVHLRYTFFHCSLRDWIYLNLKSNRQIHSGRSWSLFFGVMV